MERKVQERSYKVTVSTGKCRRNRHDIKTVQYPLRNEATGNEPELKDPETQEHGILMSTIMWSRGQPHLHHQVNIELARDEWLGLQFGGRTMFSLFIIFVLCFCWGDVVYTGVREDIRDVWDALRRPCGVNWPAQF